MKTIATLLTVHNRKEKTLQCLRCLYKQVSIEEYKVDVYVTDDGCTDGTPESILEEFPQVTIINGDGSLFWNRGMYAAWSKAVETADYDFYLWLNDDTFLFDDAILVLLTSMIKSDNKGIIVGTTCSKDNSELITYGGYKVQNQRTKFRNTKTEILKPNGELQQCDIFNGNVILIPRCIFKILGKNNSYFLHSLGDFDYALRAKEYSLMSFIATELIGTCEKHKEIPKWRDGTISLALRIKSFFSPTGCQVNDLFYYEYHHRSLLIASFHYISNIVRLFFPKI